jgi:hypothetical protein
MTHCNENNQKQLKSNMQRNLGDLQYLGKFKCGQIYLENRGICGCGELAIKNMKKTYIGDIIKMIKLG